MGTAMDTFRKSRLRVVGKKSNPERLRKFLDTLADVGVLTTAAKKAGFSTETAKNYIQKAAEGDPAFVLIWGDTEGPFNEHVKSALTMAVDRVEECVWRRATGYEEIQVFQGRIQYQIDYDAIKLGAEPGTYEAILKDKNGKPVPVTVTKQSEDLQLAILKAHRPEVYGAKTQVDVIHRGGVMVVAAPARSSAELEARAKKMAAEAVEVEFVEIEDEPVPAAAAPPGDGGDGEDPLS